VGKATHRFFALERKDTAENSKAGSPEELPAALYDIEKGERGKT